MITPKYFNPATFFLPIPSKEFLATVCLVSFSFLFTFTGVYRDNSFTVPVYHVVLGPATACPVVWLFPHCSLKTNGWPRAQIFVPLWLLSLWSITYQVFTVFILLIYRYRDVHYLIDEPHIFYFYQYVLGGFPKQNMNFAFYEYREPISFPQLNHTIDWLELNVTCTESLSHFHCAPPIKEFFSVNLVVHVLPIWPLICSTFNLTIHVHVWFHWRGMDICYMYRRF